MTFDIIQNINNLPFEIVLQILQYIQPFTCQLKLLHVPVLRYYVASILSHSTKWLVLHDTLSPITDPFAMNDIDNYIPISNVRNCINTNYKNLRISPQIDGDVVHVQNVGSLIYIIAKLRIMPKNIYFDSYETFNGCRKIRQGIIDHAETVGVRMMKYSRSTFDRDAYWFNLRNLIVASADYVTSLKLSNIYLAGLEFDKLVKLRELSISGQLYHFELFFDQFGDGLQCLELVDLNVDYFYLRYLPRNLRSLTVDKIQLYGRVMNLPLYLHEFSASFELSDDYDVIDLTQLPLLKKFTILGCEELRSFKQLHLPSQIEHVNIQRCFKLIRVQDLHMYQNLTVFEWSQALLSIDIYMSKVFPDSLTKLVINGQDSRTNSELIEVFSQILPEKFNSVYGIDCFSIGDEFRLPDGLKVLSITNCRYLQVNCKEFKLPSRLEKLTLSNLGRFQYLEDLKFPDSITYLNFTSMHIESIDWMVLPSCLTWLLLDDNKIKSIYQFLTNLHNLQKLDLFSITDNLFASSDSFAICLPANLRTIKLNSKLTNLEALPCDNIKTINVPESLVCSSCLKLNDNVEEINIHGRHFCFNDDEFRLSRQLKQLNICNLTTLIIQDPTWLFFLPPNLQILKLSVNPNGIGEVKLEDNPLDITLPSTLHQLSIINLNISQDFYDMLNFNESNQLIILELIKGEIPTLDLTELPISIQYLKLHDLGIKDMIGDVDRFENMKQLSILPEITKTNL